MAALKAAVVIMGLMIVGGLTFLVIAIIGRVEHRQRAASAFVPASRAAAPSAPLSAAPIDLPPGARIAALAVGAGRIILGITLPGGEQRLLVIDLATGRLLGTIPLHAAP